MTYRTIHTTTYRYDEPVAQSISEARAKPRTSERQRVLEFNIDISPSFAKSASRTDYFGNEVTTISVFGRHEQFVVTSTSVVETGFAQLPQDAYRDEYDSHVRGWARELGELAAYVNGA